MNVAVVVAGPYSPVVLTAAVTTQVPAEYATSVLPSKLQLAVPFATVYVTVPSPADTVAANVTDWLAATVESVSDNVRDNGSEVVAEPIGVALPARLSKLKRAATLHPKFAKMLNVGMYDMPGSRPGKTNCVTPAVWMAGREDEKYTQSFGKPPQAPGSGS